MSVPPQDAVDLDEAQLRALDEELRRLVVDLAAIDRVTRIYRRKRDGLEPWSEFDPPYELERPA